MSGKHGFYSDVIVYDERTRYYYLWAQKNKPLLDDEIRNMGIGLLDQMRRGIQHVYGDIATPNNQYSTDYFSSGESFKVKQATDTQNNFLVSGGVSIDHPAVLYVKGFYIFITGDIEYKNQTYPTDNIDLYTETDKSKTLTPIPAITTPSSDRIDIVYVSLHFNEVSASVGTDSDVYRDSNLKNPIVGTETANRLRAVIDVRVRENWTSSIDQNIFDNSEFLGSLETDSSPTDNTYNIPIAAIYRTAYDETIVTSDIVDLLTLYNKRILSLEEITYRSTHGGYDSANLSDQSLTGFTPQFPNGVIDEGAFATGLNMGFGTEALNSNSVTPRVLSNDGKFMVAGIMVGNDTGLISLETGPVALNEGELIAQQISARQLMVGYGETGITGMREYLDTVNIVHRGESGRTIVSVTNFDGDTGSISFKVKGIQNGIEDNYVMVDYDGRIGANTTTPGHTPPDAIWNTERYNDGLRGATGVNVLMEINGSAQIDDHLFIEKDFYAKRELFGKTWHIPDIVSHETPITVGYTGIPQQPGATGAAILMVKRGIAVHGETGIECYGYTGGQVAYEAFDAEGNRLFTIGDLGDNYDREVLSLYGVGIIPAYLSDFTFLTLPAPYNNSVMTGDVISYSIKLEDGTIVSGYLTLTSDGWNGVEEIRDDILYNINFPADPNQGYTGMPYSRVFQYQDYHVDGSITTETGMSYGSEIISDPSGYTGMSTDQHGRLVLKDILSGADPIELDSIQSFSITRSPLPSLDVTFTEFHYFGSGGFGGSQEDVKFAKFDLGEVAKGWLFNGDVYFNGNGVSNRVTFSPNVVFRDDVFIYGTIYADEQVFNMATVQNLSVNSNLNVYGKGYFKYGASFGPDSNAAYEILRASDSTLNLYVSGKALANEFIAQGTSTSDYIMGIIRFKTLKSIYTYAYIGGTLGSTTDPFGLHIIDNRSVVSTEKFNEFTIDFSDGRGNYSDVSLVLKGDLTLDRYFKAQYIGVGPIDEINTDYRLQVEGRALINDVLEVKALRFIGAESPEGTQDITDPSNITIIGRIADSENGEEYQNNEIILREKKFTSTKRIYLDNAAHLGYSSTDPQAYYLGAIEAYYDDPTTDPGGRWAFDTVSYTNEQFDEIVETDDTSTNEIVVEDITLTKYKKLRNERIRVASLGTLVIQWSGYFYSPSAPVTTSTIQQYYFTSSYFRNRDGGINIDWYPESERFGDDNLIAHVRADLVDTDTISPTIYSIDESIGLYIAKSKWWQYYTDPDTNGYKSVALYYPYENVVNDFNSISLGNQNTGTEVVTWKLGLFPRLIKQTRVQVGTNLDELYTGEWSMDLCILPTVVGKVANMVGNLEISYFQS